MKDKLNQPLNISITPGSVIKILFILLITYLLFVVRDLLLVLLTSVILASSVEPITKWLIRWKFPRPLAVISIYIVAIAMVVFLVTSFLPPLATDVKQIVNTIPQYVESVSNQDLDKYPGLSLVFGQINETVSGNDFLNQITTFTGQATYSFFATASAIFGGLLSFILIIVLSFYLAVQEDGVGNFLKIITPIKKEKYIIDLWKRSQRKIGLWMQRQLLLGVIVGILTYLGLMILGVKNAFLLAILAGVFELIPVFGPILSAIPAIGVALIQDGFTLAILALIVGAQIAGFLGMIIAVPVTAALMEYLSDVEKSKLEEMKKIGEVK
jgi:predicted PurR-regulated permease PerM